MTTEQTIRDYRTHGWWPDESLWDRYLSIATAHPTGLAAADDRGVELTHAGLLDASRRMSTGLADAGVQPGDLVIVIMPNRAEWQVVFAALLRLGAIPMTIPVTTDGPTLTYLCDLAEVAAVVTSTRVGNTFLGDMAIEAASKAERATPVIVVDDVAHMDVVSGGRREPCLLYTSPSPRD